MTRARLMTRARRSACALAAAALVAGVVAQPACARQEPPASEAAGSAADHYRSGRYDEAIAALRTVDNPAARRLLVRALLEVGRYEEAENAALGGALPEAVPLALANVAGEALYARGRREAAEVLFARAAATSGTDALRARLNHAIAKWERGARTEALRGFDTFIDAYNDGTASDADDLTAVGTALRYLGAGDPALFHDAVRAYEEAGRRDPAHAESRLLLGELFLEKYNSTEASALFREVLNSNARHPRALLGLARAKAFDGTDEARALVDSSLAVNPHSVAARVFRARLLLGLEQYDSAGADVERALATNAAALDAIAMLGAVRLLTNDRRGYDDARRRALELDPAFSGFDVAVAEMAAQQRRYPDAVELAQRALELDPADWSAYALLGLTQLRLGQADAARTSLDASFAGDPYNVWVKNTLDLLDTYPQYVTHRTGRFELFLHGGEADVLSLYMGELAEEAYEKLTRRYGAEPDRPVRIEVYPRSADFSVRTVGLSGLGALGVAFGNILAMDSPAARDVGAFNWGSTLWHEIAHAVTLAASNSRVPRWLTEGLSVLEEQRARPGWGDNLRMDFLIVLRQGRLLPVSELNAGFVRPTYPGQTLHAYYQASLVAEYIEKEYGERALRDMLRAYGRGQTNEQVFRGVLRVEPEAMDAKFDAYIRQRFATQLAAIEVGQDAAARPGSGGGTVASPRAAVSGEFISAMSAAHALFDEGSLTDARRQAERAVALFPEYAETNGAYRLIHRIHLAAGDRRAAAAALREQIRYNSSDYDAHIELATLLEEQQDRRGAGDVLERAMYIYPYDPQVHVKMAELYAATDQHAKAVRERRAVLALDPVNRADALYRLAAALADAGERDEARRQVLRSLEIAPNFEDAQSLLLRLRGGRP
ncbi:tetratricopeptide repeat protein [soil metagenome]